MRITNIEPGMKFGNLVAIKRTEERNNRGDILWLFKCICGNEIKRIANYIKYGHSKSCGCLRYLRGKNHKNWKGGRSPLKNGYMAIYEPEHPNAFKNGYVLEHIKVMSEMIGRPLNDGENVHHKNGVRDDNRRENLELWTVKQPPGQRVEDMITFCKSYLSQYEPIMKGMSVHE